MIKAIKKYLKIILLKYFDFYFYKGHKLNEILEYLFSFKKKIVFNDNTINFPMKSFFVYNFFKWENYENNCVKLFEVITKEFDTLIDVGANIGFYSMLFCTEKNNRSLAVELNYLTFYHLNIITKEKENIKTFNVGINNTENFIYLPKYHPLKMSMNIKNKDYSELGTKKIRLTSIDQFLNENLLDKDKEIINLIIKIDIEGSEKELFSKSEYTFKKFKPFFLLELHPNNLISKNDKMEILKQFENNLYLMSDVDQNLKKIFSTEFDDICNDKRKFLLCAPKEKTEQFLKVKEKYLKL